MQTFIGLLLMVGWFFFAYRALGWFRVQRAIHRHRLVEKWGYKENNAPRRLRGELYSRIFAVSYVGIGSVVFLILQAAIPRNAPPFFVVILPAIFGSVISLFPAAVVWTAYSIYREYTEPQGDIALAMRDKQFHKPGEPVVPNGEMGVAKFLNAKESGFTVNPVELIVRRYPIVEEAK